MIIIPGVVTKPLKVITDERGRLMEMLRRDDPIFAGFGQAYLTTAYPGVVKAWHHHNTQTDNFVCVKGMLKLVLAETSQPRAVTMEFFIGEHNPLLVQVPPLIWHGFKCVSETEALVINLPSEPYNYDAPDEQRQPLSAIGYDWERKNG